MTLPGSVATNKNSCVTDHIKWPISIVELMSKSSALNDTEGKYVEVDPVYI